MSLQARLIATEISSVRKSVTTRQMTGLIGRPADSIRLSFWIALTVVMIRPGGIRDQKSVQHFTNQQGLRGSAQLKRQPFWLAVSHGVFLCKPRPSSAACSPA